MGIKREIRKRALPLLLAVCCVCGCLVAAAPKARAWSSVEELQEYALKNWSRPLLAEINPLVGGTRFGKSRSGRAHAAIDMVVESGAGTPIYAMADGVVMEYCPDFYYGTSSVGVKNTDGSVLRYCEISTTLRNGDTVTQGQLIGKMIPNSDTGASMLHLELYLGTREGGLTDRGNSHYDHVPDGNYLRRADLLDPTFLLNITRFTGEHDHIWSEKDGRCVYCERHWTEFMDPSLHAASFVDVTVEDYCYDAVLWAVAEDISSGSGSVYFGTDLYCTRAQAMTMLWRAVGSPESGTEDPFPDVTADDYYYDAARWAYAAGVTDGAGEGLFDPEGPVTRAQAMLLLWRAAGSPEQDGTLVFEDVEDWVSYWDAVEWATVGGIADGIGPRTFGPAELCTRGQLVTFLYRAYAAETEDHNG